MEGQTPTTEREASERRGVRKDDREEGEITQSFLQKQKRYEYSNFTLLIRDGCLFLWGTVLLVFVSSLIICMMYSTALYSMMGERWRSGRLTMRPKGRRSRHSQPYSVQRSKATLLHPKLFTILVTKAPVQQLHLLAQHQNKPISWEAGHTEGGLLFWDDSL